LHIPLLEGRTFTDDDVNGHPPVAIVNEELARRYWPGQSAIGQQIRSGVGPRAAVTTIVGVVGNVRPPARREVDPQIYASYLQQSEPNITLLVRAAPGARVPIDGVKQAIWSVVPVQPFFDIRPLPEVVTQSLTGPRVIAQLLGTFALLALLMSTLGVYTVVSYLTSRRTKEVALRRAVGAQASDVVKLLAAPTMRWAAAGVIAGAVGAVAVSNTMGAVVPGVTIVEFTAVAGIAALYLLVVAVAVCAPAARALRADPAAILRAE
jgi:putative ABC transport system permease protein